MNVTLRRFDPYATDMGRVLNAILTMKSDDKIFTREDLFSLYNRCYYVEAADGSIVGVAIAKYFSRNQEVIFGNYGDPNSAIRDEHYTIQYLLLDNCIYWDGQYVNMFDVATVLIREICADTTDKMVIMDLARQCEVNISNSRDVTRALICKALEITGFGQWYQNPNIYLRVMPIDFNKMHKILG